MTPYSDVFGSFLDLILQDSTFLIKNDNADLQREINNTRLLKLMTKAISCMYLVKDSKDFEINFIEMRDDENMQFVESLTQIEIDLIAYFMFECYINEETVAKIKALKSLSFSDDEIKTFSPSNSLKEFNSAFESLKKDNIDRVKLYKRRDRSTMKYKRFDMNFGL